MCMQSALSLKRGEKSVTKTFPLVAKKMESPPNKTKKATAVM